jgi:hypothetical protein
MQVLQLLRIRTQSPLFLDELYTSFIRCASFLPLAKLVNNGLSIMDSVALLAPVNLWRLETHTFHLSCSEATMTL